MNFFYKLFFMTMALTTISLPAVYAHAQASTTLKIGVLPIHDTLLLHVAQREGYFEEQGLKVELILFHSALEKDTAARAGQLDGHFTDLTSVIIQQAGKTPFVVVASTSHTQPANRMFGLVTSPESSALKIEDLKGKSLAIANRAIVDFLGDRLLTQAGYPVNYMLRQNINKIPVRVQMLLTSQVDAAVFPEPLLTLAQEAGGRVLLDDRQLDMPLAFLALAQEKTTPETVSALRLALSRAGQTINGNLPGQRELLLELGLIPSLLADKFQQPPVDLTKIPHTLPSLELYRAYGQWLIKHGVLRNKDDPSTSKLPPLPPYEQVVWSEDREDQQP